MAGGAAERASGWLAPLLTTMLAGPSALLVLGVTRLFASGATIGSPTRSLERAGGDAADGAVDRPDQGDGPDQGVDAPDGAASADDEAALGDLDGGSGDEVSSEEERHDEEQPGTVVTGSGSSLTPDAQDRLERRRRRQRGADEEGDEGDLYAGLGPMVRHLWTMTKELSEAQRTVGRLTAERDLLLQQLGDDRVLPIGSAEAGGTRPNREARQAAKQAERANAGGPVPTPEELATRAAEAGRRRRLIALGILVTIAAAIWIGRAVHVPVGDYLSKGGVTGIPYVGIVFQVFLAGFLLFRVVRVGGKAGQWLFPSAEEPKRRRR